MQNSMVPSSSSTHNSQYVPVPDTFLKGTPIEEVARDVIIRAAIDIVGNIQQYRATTSTAWPISQAVPSQAKTKSDPAPSKAAG